MLGRELTVGASRCSGMRRTDRGAGKLRMAGADGVPSSTTMPTIVIAGGGIAGLEALIALRGHLGSAAKSSCSRRTPISSSASTAVSEPFGGAPARRFDLVRIAADHGAHLRPDRLASVDAEPRRIRTVRGDMLRLRRAARRRRRHARHGAPRGTDLLRPARRRGLRRAAGRPRRRARAARGLRAADCGDVGPARSTSWR